jgi:hypothetical protein
MADVETIRGDETLARAQTPGKRMSKEANLALSAIDAAFCAYVQGGFAIACASIGEVDNAETVVKRELAGYHKARLVWAEFRKQVLDADQQQTA